MSDFARVQGNVQKMIRLQAPEADIDGYLAQEGLTAATFKAQISGGRHTGFADEEAPQGGFLSDLGTAAADATKATGTAAMRAGTNILGTPGSLAEYAQMGVDLLAKKMGVDNRSLPPIKAELPFVKIPLPSTADLQDLVFNKIGVPQYQPKNEKQVAAGKGIEGALTVLGTGATSIPAIAGGVLSPFAADKAAEIFPNHPIAAQIFGGLAGFIGPQAAYSLGRKILAPSAESIVRDAMKGTPPAAAAEAQGTQALGMSAGLPVTGPEALNNSALLRLQQRVESAPGANPIKDILASRANDQRRVIQGAADDLAPNVQPYEAARGVKAAAETAINKAKTARTKEVEQFYEAASLETMPVRRLDPIIDSIDDQLTRVGTESKIGKKLLEYKDQIKSTFSTRGSFGDEATIGPLDAIYKETGGALKKNKFEPGALDNEVRGVLAPINKQLGLAMKAGNQNIALGRVIYQKLSPGITDLKESPIGALAKSKDPTLAKAASILLDPQTVRPDGVSKSFRILNKADSAAAPKLLGSFLDTALDGAGKRVAVRPTDVTPGSKFYGAVAGTPYMKANLRAAYNTLPNGAARADAFENTLKILDAHSNRFPVGSPTAEKIAVGADLAKGPNARAINWLNEFVQDFRTKRSLGYLGELFARSDSVEELARIANLSPGAPASAVAAARFLALEDGYMNRAGGDKQ